jgi:Rps23 Pro-64 3,4-dihydroxylase Tpa1-like proline 4-hydroxylase
MIDFEKISATHLNIKPYPWAEIGDLYSRADAERLASGYPQDHFQTLAGNDGEKGYLYQARSLIHMGAQQLSNVDQLDSAWQQLGNDLLSREYREAMSLLSGYDLSRVAIESNIYHYDPGCYLGPHLDLPEKLVVHVFYFNKTWSYDHGGCLAVLNSRNPDDVVARVLPVVGNSATFVRSNYSWHEVQRVTPQVKESRRAVVVTFYKPGSVSTMWPPHVRINVHDYAPA